MKRGEIRWYKFLAPDKKRPVVIISRNSILEYLSEVTIAPITTTIRNIPSEVFLSKEDGLVRDCVINCDHLQTVSKSKLGALVAMLPSERLAQLSQAIRFSLEI